MRIGIVGHGLVGSALVRYFSQGHQISIYDKFQQSYCLTEQKDSVNSCDLVFICVPTPTRTDGRTCDVSAVEESVRWVVRPMCIRSTIPPGTVDRLMYETDKEISFSPEYIGEQPGHPWREEGACGFVIVGGEAALCDLVTSAYRAIAGSDLKYLHSTARTAELCKYMENAFLATKVAFVNQFYDIASALQVDFSDLLDLWLADPRIGSSHTVVTAERGFRGRCLPKDLTAIIATMEPHGGAPLLEAVMEYNKTLCTIGSSNEDLLRRQALHQ